MNTIILASTSDDMTAAAELFHEYEAWLGLDLCFQGFEAELASLPGKYSPPDGRLFLAYSESELAGCIALRKLDKENSEMKRLYVRDNFRGQKVGRNLIETLIGSAREIGYQKIRLDTYPQRMAKAVHLYHSFGFVEIEPYYDNPFDGVLFMELTL